MRKPPHCSNAYHFQPCVCEHERQIHQDDTGVCRERQCGCVRFELQSNYPLIEHTTIPIRGKVA